MEYTGNMFIRVQIRAERGKPDHAISKMILAGIKQLSTN